MQAQNRFISNSLRMAAAVALSISMLTSAATSALSNDLKRPWKDKSKALVLDAYEYNPLDWMEIVKDKRIAGFIGKSSDGLSPKYCPPGRKTMCSEKWRRYSVTRELYHTRKQLAKSLGMKWGAYHLGRAGNPIKQAAHFLDFAEPKADEVIVLDIEGVNAKKYISFEDAEIFAKYVHRKIGRYPILYTNHATAQQIAFKKDEYPILSRMQLWYARYIDDVSGVFPMGNWEKPALWQFAFSGNCKKSSCPYRVKGTPRDIDVNASTLDLEAFRKAWPFDGLVEERNPKPEPESLPMAVLVKPQPAKPVKSVIPAEAGVVVQHNIGLAGTITVRAKPTYASSTLLPFTPKVSPEIKACDEYGYTQIGDSLETC